MQTHTASQRANGLALNANQLKVIAIIAMVVDHVGTGFFEYATWPYVILHLIGRTTGPLMFYFVTVGYRHTRNVNRYTARLAIFALVSYLPYIYFHTGALPTADSWMQLNVIYTLLLGLLAVRAQHEVKSLIIRFPLLILLFILSTFGDWGNTALMFMLAFDYFCGDIKKQSFAYLLVAAAQSGLLRIFTHPFLMYRHQGALDFSAYPGSLYYLGMLLPILLLQIYNGHRGGGGSLAKWAFYLFYPLHFIVLGYIKYHLTA